jgi:hypothetical protein
MAHPPCALWRYFAATLDVIEAMTLVAILN